MKKLSGIFTIKEIYALPCSINGNPKREIVMEDENGRTYYAKTATDAMVGYLVAYNCKGEKFNFTYHYTKKGSCVIDYGERI